MAAEQTRADHQVIAGAVVMKSIGHQEGVAGDRLRLNAEEAVSRIAAALREQLGTRRPMDRAVDTAAAEQ